MKLSECCHFCIVLSFVLGAYGNRMDKDKAKQRIKNAISDTDHLREEFGGLLKQAKVEKMSMRKLAFHFFQIHDFDENRALDGNEILAGLRHMKEHSKWDDDDFSDENIVDLMLDHDQDDDGLLTYREYRQYVLSTPEEEEDEINIFQEQHL